MLRAPIPVMAPTRGMTQPPRLSSTPLQLADSDPYNTSMRRFRRPRTQPICGGARCGKHLDTLDGQLATSVAVERAWLKIHRSGWKTPVHSSRGTCRSRLDCPNLGTGSSDGLEVRHG